MTSPQDIASLLPPTKLICITLYAESVLTVAATKMTVGNTMSEMKQRIHDEVNGLDYILAGDYYIPAIKLPEDDDRPIGKWGRMHRAYLEECVNLFL